MIVPTFIFWYILEHFLFQGLQSDWKQNILEVNVYYSITDILPFPKERTLGEFLSMGRWGEHWWNIAVFQHENFLPLNSPLSLWVSMLVFSTSIHEKIHSWVITNTVIREFRKKVISYFIVFPSLAKWIKSNLFSHRS